MMSLKDLFSTRQKDRMKYILDHRHLLFPSSWEHQFVIYGQGRSGSTLLVNLLNQQDQVCCDGELFNINQRGGRVLFPESFIRARASKFRKHYPQKSAYGFRLKIYELINDHDLSPKTFLTQLTNAGYLIIYLKRSNVLSQSLSNLKADRSGAYHFENESSVEKPEKLPIDYKTLRHYMDAHIDYLEKEKRSLEGIDHLALTYETDLKLAINHRSTIRKVADYIGVPYMEKKAEGGIIKDPTKPAEWIANWEELSSLLQEDGYGEFLDGV